jgi:hypothetical protein
MVWTWDESRRNRRQNMLTHCTHCTCVRASHLCVWALTWGPLRIFVRDKSTVLWCEVVGCIVLGSLPSCRMTIQHTVFPEVAVISSDSPHEEPSSKAAMKMYLSCLHSYNILTILLHNFIVEQKIRFHFRLIHIFWLDSISNQLVNRTVPGRWFMVFAQGEVVGCVVSGLWFCPIRS